jgi:hypothetical protein
MLRRKLARRGKGRRLERDAISPHRLPHFRLSYLVHTREDAHRDPELRIGTLDQVEEVREGDRDRIHLGLGQPVEEASDLPLPLSRPLAIVQAGRVEKIVEPDPVPVGVTDMVCQPSLGERSEHVRGPPPSEGIGRELSKQLVNRIALDPLNEVRLEVRGNGQAHLRAPSRR